MMQPHNRHVPFSVYISALAVSDNIVLLNGKFHPQGRGLCCWGLFEGYELHTTITLLYDTIREIQINSGCARGSVEINQE